MTEIFAQIKMQIGKFYDFQLSNVKVNSSLLNGN